MSEGFDFKMKPKAAQEKNKKTRADAQSISRDSGVLCRTGFGNNRPGRGPEPRNSPEEVKCLGKAQLKPKCVRMPENAEIMFLYFRELRTGFRYLFAPADFRAPWWQPITIAEMWVTRG